MACPITEHTMFKDLRNVAKFSNLEGTGKEASRILPRNELEVKQRAKVAEQLGQDPSPKLLDGYRFNLGKLGK